MRKTLSCAACLLFLCTILSAQEIIFEHYPQGLDFWVVIPYNTIIFKQAETSARYQLTLQIKNKDKRQVFDQTVNLDIPRRDWLRDTAIPMFLTAVLEPGKYQAAVRIKNLSPGEKIDLKKTLIVQENYTEIGQAYFLASKDGVSFMPSGLASLPLPVQNCEIRQKFSAPVDSIQVWVDDTLSGYTAMPGGYSAELAELVNQGGVKSVRISFFEDNIRYNMEPFWYDRWFSYNFRYSYADQIQQLRYVANQNEWKSIRSVPEEMYPEVIERFWQMHDPSPGTLRNEARESFYQRVVIADERYTIHKRLQGWNSDRGRIYIKYGEPDEVHSEVHPLDLYPYIVWIYYAQNLEFEFADTGGFGQYELRNKDEEY